MLPQESKIQIVVNFIIYENIVKNMMYNKDIAILKSVTDDTI